MTRGEKQACHDLGTKSSSFKIGQKIASSFETGSVKIWVLTYISFGRKKKIAHVNLSLPVAELHKFNLI
jgi:hypothetical protein